jgi:zinc transporter ZupT
MAISGSAAPSFLARIVDGKLELTQQALRQGTVTQIDLALHRLLAGETVFVSARADITGALQRTLDMMNRGDA